MLLDTGAQVTCMDSAIFEQLRIPQSDLKPKNTNIAAANGSPLKVLGTIDLGIECFCYKVSCPGFKVIPFHVIAGLSEQVLLSNRHCQQLGLVSIRDDDDKTASAPRTEHPVSFRSLINNLALSWPENGNVDRDKHTCPVQEDTDLNELESIAS